MDKVPVLYDTAVIGVLLWWDERSRRRGIPVDTNSTKTRVFV
jgi:hypothetical protein